MNIQKPTAETTTEKDLTMKFDAEGQPYQTFALTRTHGDSVETIGTFDVSYMGGRPMFDWFADFILDALEYRMITDLSSGGCEDRSFGSWLSIIETSAWRGDTAREFNEQFAESELWRLRVWVDSLGEFATYGLAVA